MVSVVVISLVWVWFWFDIFLKMTSLVQTYAGGTRIALSSLRVEMEAITRAFEMTDELSDQNLGHLLRTFLTVL